MTLDNVVATGEAPGVSIERHLATLGTELRLPEAALTACVARFQEAAAPLRALLERAAAGDDLSEDEALQCFRGLFVLAAARDVTACRPLLRLLRRPNDEVEDLLGDAITVSLPRLIVSVFDGDAEALLAVAADMTLDEYLRGSVLEAATYLAWERRLDRECLRCFLVDFHERRLAAGGQYVWHSWMSAVALLDFEDLLPEVKSAWTAGLIDKTVQDWSDFEGDLARARSAYDDVGRFDPWQLGYVDDVLAALEWTRHWGDERAAGPEQLRPSPAQPVINRFRNVGRNDPCPCGSGKKAKKCCLAAA